SRIRAIVFAGIMVGLALFMARLDAPPRALVFARRDGVWNRPSHALRRRNQRGRRHSHHACLVFSTMAGSAKLVCAALCSSDCRAARWIPFPRRAVCALSNGAHGVCLFHQIYCASTSRRSVGVERPVRVGKGVRQLRTRARQSGVISTSPRLSMAAPRADGEPLCAEYSWAARFAFDFAYLFISPLASVGCHWRVKIHARAKSFSRRDVVPHARLSAFRHRRTVSLAITSCGNAVGSARAWRGG